MTRRAAIPGAKRSTLDDGRNDKPVIVDERLLNCPDSADGIHHPFRSRDGQRCADCGAYIRDSFRRPIAPVLHLDVDAPADVEQFWQDLGRPEGEDAALDHDLIRLGSDFQ